MMTPDTSKPTHVSDQQVDSVLQTVIPVYDTAATAPISDSDHAVDRYDLPHRPPPPPIPNGWFAAGRSGDLAPGGIRSFVAVERELVVYRDAAGTARVSDAHCPHLGAHLGDGIVIEDSIKCPYHGWRFGPDGACVEIPYHEGRIPERACLRQYPVDEHDGFIYFWFHDREEPPSYTVPHVPELAEPGWSAAHPWSLELVASLPEMGENNVDYAHLRYVHRRPVVPDDTSVFTTDGPFSRVVEKLPDNGPEFTRDAWGPGVALLRIPDMMILLTTATPIDRRHSRLQWNFHFPGELVGAAEQFVEGVTGRFGLTADIPIWRDKVYRTRPVLVRSDGNIAEFRQWYSQFYSGD